MLNHVSALARNGEAHKYHVQMQVRQLEQKINDKFWERKKQQRCGGEMINCVTFVQELSFQAVHVGDLSQKMLHNTCT